LGKSSVSNQAQHGKFIKAVLVPFLLAWRAMAMRRKEGMWESRALWL
jgi:hypothetical protein